LKVAYLFYYQGKVESGATGHLEPKHIEPCVNSLLSTFDQIIIRDDGSENLLLATIKNPKVEYLRVPKRQGIQSGYRWAAEDCQPDDIVMLVDPHNIYDENLLREQLAKFDNPRIQVVFQDVTPFRIRVGDWAKYRTEMNGPIGAEDWASSILVRGAALKRYKAEYSDKLDPADQSYPMPHFQAWIDKFLQKDEHVSAQGPVVGDLHRHIHDDTLDLWGQLRSCYNAGFKSASVSKESFETGRNQALELLRGPSLAQKWDQVESLIGELGMAAAKFKVREDIGYWDTYWASEDVDYRFLSERPYMMAAANYVVGDVLDVGCGSGLFLNCLWNQRPHYHFPDRKYEHMSGVLQDKMPLWFPFATGIDTSRVAIQKAKAYRKFNRNRVIDFHVADFLEFAGQQDVEDTYDTVLMLDFLPYIPWQRRQDAVDLAMRITRHRIIATFPAMQLPIPSILKDKDGYTWFTNEKIADLFQGIPEPLYIYVAEMQGSYVAKWFVVADKRPVEEDWQPSIGKMSHLQKVEVKGMADGGK
jgi:SAM-dependent methyltransferase